MPERLLLVDTGRKRPYELEITCQDVTLRGLPANLHGLTLVHLSDLHGGYGNTDSVFEEAVAQVNALKPDLLLITGDYVDDHADNHYLIAPVLQRFSARLGVYGSFGNHEHRRGIVQARRAVEQGGVRLLVNERLCLENGLWLAGLDDLYEGQPDIPLTLHGIPENVTPIIMSHHPRLVERIGNRDALILSGHTHGGQIRLAFPTPKMVCMLHLRCPQVAGWYQRGKARLYVNRGLGVTGKPYRYRCPAEIGVFRLLSDQCATTPNV